MVVVVVVVLLVKVDRKNTKTGFRWMTKFDCCGSGEPDRKPLHQHQHNSPCLSKLQNWGWLINGRKKYVPRLNINHPHSYLFE
jgi:hypothetical protein